MAGEKLANLKNLYNDSRSFLSVRVEPEAAKNKFRVGASSLIKVLPFSSTSIKLKAKRGEPESGPANIKKPFI